jgi:hypothetical protein
MLVLLVMAASAQQTLFSQPVGNDTFKLKADACVWPRYWWQGSTLHQETLFTRDSVPVDSAWTKTTRENTFNQVFGFVGATAQFSKHAYLRFYYDLGTTTGRPAYDLFAAVTLGMIDVRFGQLKLPLGYEVICAPWRIDLIDNTLAAANRTPSGGTRDIGVLHTFSHKYFQGAFAIVNGNGRNLAKDNNPQKDVFARLVAMPLGKPDLTLGAHAYWGNDTFAREGKDRPFTRYAGELYWMPKRYFVRGEYLWGRDTLGAKRPGDTTGALTARALTGFQVTAGCRFGNLQPVIRFERLIWSLNDWNPPAPRGPNDAYANTTSTITVGINGFLFNDMVRPMFDIAVSRNENEKARLAQTGTYQTDALKFSLQLQAAFW